MMHFGGAQINITEWRDGLAEQQEDLICLIVSQIRLFLSVHPVGNAIYLYAGTNIIAI